MTESNASKPSGHDTTPKAPAKDSNEAQSKATNAAGAKKAPPRPGSRLKWAFVLVLLIAVALAALAWFQYQTYQQSQARLTQQVNQSLATVGQADALGKQLQAQAQSQAGQIQQLQATVSALQDQVGSLDQAFQVVSDSGSDLVLLNDIDHLVSIASQQINLGGNVANAVVALETAQARLSRANRPALASLQQTLNGDLERLRASATVDVPSVSRQLEQLSGQINQAPLLVPDDAVPQVDTSERDAALAVTTPPELQIDPDAPWWRQGLDTSVHWAGRAWSVVRHDLAGFISVRRVDDQAALLISPDQAEQLRLTLRLRIMTAQLALMMRQPDVWKTELEAVAAALQSHFDGNSPLTQRAMRLATRLIDTPVDTKLPALNQTLEALEALRQESARAIEQRRSASSLEPDDTVSPKAGEAAALPDAMPEAPAAEPTLPGATAPAEPAADALTQVAPASVKG